MNLGLEAIKRCLTELGNPQDNFSIIYVTGTNGKGSVCMLLSKFFRQYNIGKAAVCMDTNPCMAAASRSTRLRWGVFTSPPLLHPWDMMQINGIELNRKMYEEKKAAIEKTAKGFLTLTGFEKDVVLAITLFRDHCVQIGVIEAGIGHELDATNVFSGKRLVASVMTSISIDHSEILGKTVEDIVGHKVHIGRKGRAMFVSPQSSEALTEIIGKKCLVFGIGPVYYVERICKVSFNSDGNEFGCEIQGLLGKKTYRIAIPKFPLLGDHQRKANLPTAICVFLYTMLVYFREKHQDLVIRSVVDGWDEVRFSGRLEKLDDVSDIYKGIKERFPALKVPGTLDGVYAIVDGAHNVEGMRKLAEFVRKTEEPAVKTCWIIGITDRKDAYGILSEIKKSWAKYGIASERCFYFVSFRASVGMEWVKCITPQELAKTFAKVIQEETYEQDNEIDARMTRRQISVMCDMSLEEALVDCIERKEKKTMIVISGSLYLISDLYRLRCGSAGLKC